MIVARFVFPALIAALMCSPLQAQSAAPPDSGAVPAVPAPTSTPPTASTTPAAACDVSADYLTGSGHLERTAAAIKAGKLSIVVLGSRSSTVGGTDGRMAFPGRLQEALRHLLPKVETTVVLEFQPRKTAEDVAPEIAKLIEQRKPSLLIWQTGTVDAMRNVDIDDFRSALDTGLDAASKEGTDAILLNLQYSPRTETMIDGSAYMDSMRVAAQQYEVPLFDRYSIMRSWHEAGVFDLFSTSPGNDLAQRVHDCLAKALAVMILDRATAPVSQGK